MDSTQDDSERLTDRNYWIFQSSTKRFRIIDAIKELSEMDWYLRQHKHEVKRGDRVFVWVAGSTTGDESGIYATGIVTRRSEWRKFEAGKEYWIEQTKLEYNNYIALVKFTHKFSHHPIPRKLLEKDTTMSEHQIITRKTLSQAPLDEKQAFVLMDLILERECDD